MVNPKYNSSSWGVTHNCQRCVVAYEARRRGWNVEAKECPGTNDKIMNGDYIKVFKNPVVSQARSIDNIKRLMSDVYGESSRAIISVTFQPGNVGYVFIAEQINGKTCFIDPQYPQRDARAFLTENIARYATITRIDKLEIDNTLIHECCLTKNA